MPMPLSIPVGPSGPAAAGSTPQLRLGPTAEVVTHQMYGKYYEATRLGLVFTVSQAIAGVALLTATSTTVNFALYNPPSTGKRAIIQKVVFGYVVTTQIAGNILYAVSSTPVSTVTGTALTILNNLQFGPASAMQAFSTATVGAASTLLRPSRYSNVVMTAAGTNTPWQYDEDIDGSIVIPPAGLLAIGGSIALGSTLCIAVTWVEIPHVLTA